MGTRLRLLSGQMVRTHTILATVRKIGIDSRRSALHTGDEVAEHCQR